MTPEGKVKAKVKRALVELPGCYRFMPVQQGMGMPALDFYCCWRGLFFAIETKTKGKKLTARQEQTAADIRTGGGKVFVCDDDASINTMIRTMLRHASNSQPSK